MRPLPQVTSCLVLAALVSPGRGAFDVAPKTRLERQVEITQYLEQTEQQATLDGVKRTAPLKLGFATKTTLVVRDDVRRVGEGRPLELRRRFEDLSGSAAVRNVVGTQEFSSSAAASSELKGASVVYTWSPEESEWGRYYDEEELAESLLGPLRQDLDALRFRPGAEPTVGEEWTIEPAAMADLLAPLGDLALEYDSSELGPFVRPLHVGIGARTHLGFSGAIDGQVQATWKGTRTVEGIAYDVIAIEFELTASADCSALYSTQLTFEEFRAGMRVNEAQTHWSARGEGELYLADSGYLAQAKIDGTQDFSLRWSGVLPVPEGESVSIVEESKYQGTLSVALKASEL